MLRSSARNAANTQPSKLICNAPTSNVSACSAIGIIPTARWMRNSKPTCCARWRRSTPTATSRAASSLCTGASTVARPWPKPRLNTPTRFRRRSMSRMTQLIQRRWRRSLLSRWTPTQLSPCRSGRRRRGRCRRVWRCRLDRIWNTCWPKARRATASVCCSLSPRHWPRRRWLATASKKSTYSEVQRVPASNRSLPLVIPAQVRMTERVIGLRLRRLAQPCCATRSTSAISRSC